MVVRVTTRSNALEGVTLKSYTVMGLELHGFDEFMIPIFETESGASLLKTTSQVLGG